MIVQSAHTRKVALIQVLKRERRIGGGSQDSPFILRKK